MYICVCIYITTTKKPHHVSDLSKLDALLHLQRYQGSTCVDPKTTHQIWHINHSAKQTSQ